LVAIPEALMALYPAANPITDWTVVNNGTPVITYWNPSLGAQPTQSQIDAVTQAQVDAAKLAKLRSAAKQFHLALDAENRALRATVKILVDELNILRQWMTDMKAATASSTNYATLKSGIAALSSTPQRTYLQARTAIETLIDAES
jgi:hypothetical protein